MRNLLIIGMMLAVASMAGWLRIQGDGERTTIEIDRREIRSDAKQAIERGREFLDRRERKYAEQQQSDQQLFTGQPGPWHQEQGSTQQQWETNYNSTQQPSAYRQVQFYNETDQSGQPSGNQALNPAPSTPYLQPQDYRR